MPRAPWGIDAEVIDDWDRSEGYTPYAGPTPPNAVYQFQIKVCKYVAATKAKKPQLRVGLELVPRSGRDEKPYKGYFIMMFLTISPRNPFTYAPFCDAIGVSGKEFTKKTIIDEDGNVKKIGAWRNDGTTTILGQLKDGTDQNGNSRKEIGWVGAIDEDAELDDDEDDDEDTEDEEDDDDEDEAPVRKASKGKSKRRKKADDDDEF